MKKQEVAFEKAPQNFFAPEGASVFNTARSGAKVFWFFFSKKNFFLPLRSPP
jgi:hypothetical protein